MRVDEGCGLLKRDTQAVSTNNIISGRLGSSNPVTSTTIMLHRLFAANVNNEGLRTGSVICSCSVSALTMLSSTPERLSSLFLCLVCRGPGSSQFPVLTPPCRPDYSIVGGDASALARRDSDIETACAVTTDVNTLESTVFRLMYFSLDSSGQRLPKATTRGCR